MSNDMVLMVVSIMKIIRPVGVISNFFSLILFYLTLKIMVVLIKSNPKSSVEIKSANIFIVSVILSPQSQPVELCFTELDDAVDFARKCIDDPSYAVGVASSLQPK